ncbi:MAG: hypothetical protein R2838_08405 [Caldilineaceae bacterium]
MEALIVGLDHGLLTGFSDDTFDLFGGLLHLFFDARRVDAPIGHQLAQGHAGNLARTGSKLLMMMASGVSSTTRSTPTACSMARCCAPADR